MAFADKLKSKFSKLPPRQQQLVTAATLLGGGVITLWLVLSMGSTPTVRPHSVTQAQASPTNLGIQAPGQINPQDSWIGSAGRDLAGLKANQEAQSRDSTELRAREDAMMKRLAELEQRQAAPESSIPTQAASPAPATKAPLQYPPGSPLPTQAVPYGNPAQPAAPATDPPRVAPQLDSPPVIIRLGDSPATAAPSAGPAMSQPSGAADKNAEGGARDLGSYLPVGFIPGILLGGLDAPTGGQAQSNPQPIMIRLTDNAILPNQFRSEVKDCFVVASGYGDVSSERAYARTDRLSCVRIDGNNGSAIEIPIQGNIYGEDGKLGIRGRLVTKQGQILANALRAAIVGGIGQGFSQGGTTFTSSPFGTLTTTTGSTSEQMRRGVAGGFGRALDNLANYYIKLAEQTFPVIEVDAGRRIEVALTKGVALPPMASVPNPDGNETIGAKNYHGNPNEID
ncbi:conjugal transfer protein TraB [Duganella sp. FT92W]|uniref:Conjugal transfer protein TraB n=1 Tax=Pseudoduganella rivuli TaxID=2666085 RepID=A0A7X2IIC1_9BURK|nr:TraB/VirB10 family protein [Pseudoduganella rivuli]MRV70572.1 conjugal transfer protein TraB [Pseudoduganella rivuli]